MKLPLITQQTESFQTWLQRLSESGMQVTVTPVDCRTVQLALAQNLPDAALLDLRDGMLPLSIFQAALQRAHPGARVGLVGVARPDQVSAMLAADLDDVVVETADADELLHRLRRVRERTGSKAAEIEVGNLTIHPREHRVELGGRPISLRRREFDLLLFLASRPDRVHRREDLAGQVWGAGLSGSLRSVDTHICRLRSRLGEYGERHIETVRGIGYRLANSGVRCRCCARRSTVDRA